MKTPSKEKQNTDDALKSVIAKEASNKLQLIHSTRVNYVSNYPTSSARGLLGDP